MRFLKRKSLESIIANKDKGACKLNKSLGAFDLILLGFGGIVGTGVFVLTGLVAAQYSGPAVIISYLIAGVTCIFVALAYTELITMVPTAGSIYTYCYIVFGEAVAWIMGGMIILEFCCTAAAVAVGWSGYAQATLQVLGISLPDCLTKTPGEGGILNLPALFITVVVCCILYIGNKSGKTINTILVVIKMLAIMTFIVVAAPHFDIKNWERFIPFGRDNVIVGASILFFAFTGFAALATASEECKNPKRDLTIGLIGSILLATAVYMAVGGLITGIVHYTELNNAQPLAYALAVHGNNWGVVIVAIGAVCGMPSVMILSIYGISRIFYVIARDGLLPSALTRLHPKYHSPYITIILCSLITAILCAFCPLQFLGQLSSAAVLIDYIVIVVIVLLFRYTEPQMLRTFKCPAIFIIAPCAIFAAGFLLFKQIFNNDGALSFVGICVLWWVVGMLIAYSIRMIYICRPKKISCEMKNL